MYIQKIWRGYDTRKRLYSELNEYYNQVDLEEYCSEQEKFNHGVANGNRQETYSSNNKDFLGNADKGPNGARVSAKRESEFGKGPLKKDAEQFESSKKGFDDEKSKSDMGNSGKDVPVKWSMPFASKPDVILERNSIKEKDLHSGERLTGDRSVGNGSKEKFQRKTSLKSDDKYNPNLGPSGILSHLEETKSKVVDFNQKSITDIIDISKSDNTATQKLPSHKLQTQPQFHPQINLTESSILLPSSLLPTDPLPTKPVDPLPTKPTDPLTTPQNPNPPPQHRNPPSSEPPSATQKASTMSYQNPQTASNPIPKTEEVNFSNNMISKGLYAQNTENLLKKNITGAIGKDPLMSRSETTVKTEGKEIKEIIEYCNEFANEQADRWSEILTNLHYLKEQSTDKDPISKVIDS